MNSGGKGKNKTQQKKKTLPKNKGAQPKKQGKTKTKQPKKNVIVSVGSQYKGIRAIMGSGDYSIKENSIHKECGALPMGTEVPKFTVNNRFTRITHREFVGDVISPGDGLPYSCLRADDINPTNKNLFPWLSGIANSFQQFKFNGMVVEFKSSTSDFATGGALGTVIISTNYNANMPIYPTKQAAENSEFAVSAKPSLCQIHSIECSPRERPTEYLYLQRDALGVAGDPLSVSDKRLTSFGTLQLGCQGLSATKDEVCGEYWVSYDVTFLKPVINSPAGLPLNFSQRFIQRVSSTTASAPTLYLPFGQNPVVANADYAIISNSIVAGGTANRMTFNQPGAYYMVQRFENATNSPTTVLGTGVTQSNAKSYATTISGVPGITTHRYMKVTAAGATMDYISPPSSASTSSTSITVFLGVADAVIDAVLSLF